VIIEILSRVDIDDQRAAAYHFEYVLALTRSHSLHVCGCCLCLTHVFDRDLASANDASEQMEVCQLIELTASDMPHLEYVARCLASSSANSFASPLQCFVLQMHSTRSASRVQVQRGGTQYHQHLSRPHSSTTCWHRYFDHPQQPRCDPAHQCRFRSCQCATSCR
jgi:hypothetical protein